MHLRAISRALDVSLDTLYSELRGMRIPEKAETKVEGGSFQIGEILAAYLTLYGFYDLYSKNFPYTSEHCREIPSFSVLERVLETRDAESAGIDRDRHLAAEFRVEEENAGLSPSEIERKFS